MPLEEFDVPILGLIMFKDANTPITHNTNVFLRRPAQEYTHYMSIQASNTFLIWKISIKTASNIVKKKQINESSADTKG